MELSPAPSAGGRGFLSLPPEIRVLVYRRLLVRPLGVHIKEQTGKHRLTIFHCGPTACAPGHPGYGDLSKVRSRPASLEGLSAFVLRQSMGLGDLVGARDERGVQTLQRVGRLQRRQRAEQGPRPEDRIWTGIMATCRLVYAETAGLLYGQTFSFAGTQALFAFLAPLGPAPLAQLRAVRVLGWEDQRAITSKAVPALALLARAANLRRLSLACSLGRRQDWAWSDIFPPPRRRGPHHPGACFHRPVDLVASKVYRDCVYWLRPVFAARGMRGVRQVLHVHEQNLMPQACPYRVLPPFTDALREKMQARFWAMLEVLLEGKTV